MSMTLKGQITDDMKVAMRAGDNETRDALRMLLAAIKQVEKDTQQDTLKEADVLAIVNKQAKQRRESIAEYEKAGRADLAAVEITELAIIERYLPQQMSREEISALVAKVIAEVGVNGPKDKGKVMGSLMPQVKGKADGRLVNEVVTELLSQS